MNKRRAPIEILFDVANAFILIFLSSITLYPFLYVAFASFSEYNELASHSGLLLSPAGFSIAAYKAVFENPMIAVGYKNTLIYVVCGTAINLFMTSLAAYVMSRKNYFWNKIITIMVIFTMFFSGGLIPMYLLVKGLGMYNTLWALIIPTAISTWNLMIMRTSFAAIPDSLEESARIDGANDFVILYRIILPLSTPVIAVMVLYYGVFHWNSWFSAMIYLRERGMYPLQLVLREILIVNSTSSMMTSIGAADQDSVAETIKYATIMVATVPILLAYPFLQKYFVKGIMIGAVKG